MNVSTQYSLANELFQSGLFSKVYHSVELIEDEQGVVFPIYRKGSEGYYVGPDDTKGRFAYIREMPEQSYSNEPHDCGTYLHKSNAVMRLVVFSAHESVNFSLLEEKIFNELIKNGSVVTRTYSGVKTLKQLETRFKKEKAFGLDTFYSAFDFKLEKFFIPNDCEDDICKEFKNPIC